LTQYLLGAGGRQRFTVGPYVRNERAVRGWLKPGFRRVEEREPDDDHLQCWLLMEFDPALGRASTE
jgi:hypothetical protein